MLSAVFWALVTAVAMRFVFVSTRRAISSTEEWLWIALATLILGVPSVVKYKCLLGWRIWVFGLVLSAAAGACNLTVVSLVNLSWQSKGVAFTPYLGSSLVPVILMEHHVALAAVLATTFAWVLSRTIRGPVRVTTLINCPTCGYNLAGAVDSRCSECGHIFTCDELGVSQEYLDCYLRTQGRIARPISVGTRRRT